VSERAAPHLQVADLVVGYVRGLPVIHGVSLEVARREVVTLIGPNGAGKSTVLKAVAGVIASEGGRSWLGGQDVTALPAHAAVAAGIGFVPQTGNVFTTLTVHENLTVGGHVIAGALGARLERAYELFPPLAGRRALRARALSGGERQMLAIGSALACNPELLLVDELSQGLAPLVIDELMRRLQAIRSQTGTTILLVEQNAQVALDMADYGYVIENGRIVLDGTPERLRSHEDIREFYLGGGEGRRSYREVKQYRRSRRWYG
jgi:branched-chain amino acid transport system ATP-binding protein